MKKEIRMVKVSTCPNCKNMVCAGIPDKLSDDFWKEVKKYKLNVQDMTLEKFNKANMDYCQCR